MDMSKLPRLSKTDAPPPPEGDDPHAVPVARERYPDYRREDPDGLIGSGLEMWLTGIVGLVFVFIGWTFGKYLVTKLTGGTFSTGVDWVAGPKAGQPVEYAELQGFAMLSDAGAFLFGLCLLIDAVMRVVYRIGIPGRKILVGGALLLTVLATGLNLYAMGKLFGAGVLPLFSLLAVGFGGMVLVMQWQLLVMPDRPPQPALATIAPTRPAAAAAAHAAQQVVAQTLGTATNPRCTHFRFAHNALRQAAFENPARCVGTLQGPESSRFLRELWQAVRAGCGPSSVPSDDEPTGLEADITQLGPYAGAMVTLPAAKVKGEAHFVALVLRSYARPDGSVVERHPLLLYYALEVADGTREDGSPRTSLCEWQGGDHVTFGEGPPANASAFREALQERVAAQQKREDELAAQGGAM